MRGVSLVFAKSVCEPARPDVQVVSAARKDPESQWDRTDALSWYRSNFTALNMTNDVSGVDTLRHVYTLLLSLGMQESSGKLCCGRDMSADFSSAESAEAGAWQASWGARRASPVLPPMFAKYKASKEGCFTDVFSAGVKCSTGDATNWGTGDGAEWQALVKTCPGFAAEYAAVLLRTTGGNHGEFGPLRRKAAEIVPECNDMFKQVQNVVTGDPRICALLK
jgi:hypothetical protein